MPEAILPDKILLKLVTQARLKTVDLILEEVSGWILAKQYEEDVLKVLEPIDKGWIEKAEQRKEENRAKQAKQSAENKIRCEETACAARRQASDERKAAEQASVLQSHQLSSIAPMLQPLQSYTPGTAPLEYLSHYPYPYYSYYPYAYSHHQTMLNQSASSSQPAPYTVYPCPTLILILTTCTLLVYSHIHHCNNITVLLLLSSYNNQVCCVLSGSQ